jgi:hypothetical protein
MKTILIIIILSNFIYAKVNVDVHIGVPLVPIIVAQPAPEPEEEPNIVFETLPSVTLVMPGVYVVPNYETEIFCVSGVYWTQRHNHWYKYGDHRWAPSNRPPHSIAKLPRGKYKHWRPAPEGMAPIKHGKQGHHGKWKD